MDPEPSNGRITDHIENQTAEVSSVSDIAWTSCAYVHYKNLNYSIPLNRKLSLPSIACNLIS